MSHSLRMTGNDSEFYGFLQTTHSTTGPIFTEEVIVYTSTTEPSTLIQSIASDGDLDFTTASNMSPSPASQLAGLDLPQLHIHSSSDTDIGNIQQFSPPALKQSLKRHSKGKRLSSPSTRHREAKRAEFHYNPESLQVKPLTTLTYIAERIEDQTNSQQSPHEFTPTFNPNTDMPNYYPLNYKNWENRTIFPLEPNLKSPTGLTRTDLYVYAIEANTETRTQCSKQKYRRAMHLLQTPFERFHPQIWDAEHAQIIGNPILTTEYLQGLPFFQEPYENAQSVKRTPSKKFEKVPHAIPEPLTQLHPDPPRQEHSLSPEAQYLLSCEEPVEFFDAIYSPHEIKDLLEETILYHKQQNSSPAWQLPTYQEMRCFIGLIMWTSLAQFPNRRAYFTTTSIYHLPHFKAHTTGGRFEQLLTMLHFIDNEKLPQDLGTARRFEAKLGNQLSAVNQ